MFKTISILLLSLTMEFSADPLPFLTHDPKQEIAAAQKRDLLASHWRQSEPEAVEATRAENKPLVIAFLGDGWCPWSEKLAGEVLDKADFVEAMGKEAILLHIPLTQESAGQKSDLREKYQVYQCPYVIAYDVDGTEVGRWGYLPLTAAQYAGQIKEWIAQYREIKAFLADPPSDISEESLQQLYRHAKNLSSPVLKDKLLQIGIGNEKGTFFILEKYAGLLEQLKFKHFLVQEMRQKVLARDPQNREGTHMKLAILEFQKLAQTLRKKDPPLKALSPLIEYVKKFGKKDNENVWKIEMMIAQYCFSKNLCEEALAHAQASLAAAPPESQTEIAHLVEYLKANTKK